VVSGCVDWLLKGVLIDVVWVFWFDLKVVRTAVVVCNELWFPRGVLVVLFW